MKTLLCGLTMSLGVFASAATAEQMFNVDGTDYPLSTLMETCQGMTNDPAAQLACFSDLSKLMEEQANAVPEDVVSVPDAFVALQTAAQYQDEDSGLLIAGAECNVHIVYYNNYFHISRRNISEIDLFSAQFDASQLQYDQIVQDKGGQAPLSTGVMDAGAVAAMRGGAVLDSSKDNFGPRSPRTTLAAYAGEVIGQLSPREAQTFEFVLIHPKRSQSSADIWSAFETFVKACKS